MINQAKEAAGSEEQSELETKFDRELTDDEKIDMVANQILEKYKPAFLELAK